MFFSICPAKIFGNVVCIVPTSDIKPTPTEKTHRVRTGSLHVSCHCKPQGQMEKPHHWPGAAECWAIPKGVGPCVCLSVHRQSGELMEWYPCHVTLTCDKDMGQWQDVEDASFQRGSCVLRNSVDVLLPWFQQSRSARPSGGAIGWEFWGRAFGQLL